MTHPARNIRAFSQFQEGKAYPFLCKDVRRDGNLSSFASFVTVLLSAAVPPLYWTIIITEQHTSTLKTLHNCDTKPNEFLGVRHFVHYVMPLKCAGCSNTHAQIELSIRWSIRTVAHWDAGWAGLIRPAGCNRVWPVQQIAAYPAAGQDIIVEHRSS